jgi:hypothetical protein
LPHQRPQNLCHKKSRFTPLSNSLSPFNSLLSLSLSLSGSHLLGRQHPVFSSHPATPSFISFPSSLPTPVAPSFPLTRQLPLSLLSPRVYRLSDFRYSITSSLTLFSLIVASVYRATSALSLRLSIAPFLGSLTCLSTLPARYGLGTHGPFPPPPFKYCRCPCVFLVSFLCLMY